uniref:Innexin n=1 Tax=Ornithodoros turicata TaxID=34597 RepID=A0A2R5L4Q5_9ACAR
MFDLLGQLRSYFKTNYVIIDNFMCRLHYKASVGILIAFSILVTGKQYVGDPIDCISKDSVPHDLLDTYCWIHKTFSVPSAWEKKLGDEVAYPGVAPRGPTDDVVYHTYYQWVCFVLFLQALFFYIPRYIWKTLEGRRVQNLTELLSKPVQDAATAQKAKEASEMLIDYLDQNRNYHGGYYFSFVFTEVLYLINVVAQIFIVDRFLGGEFSTYGVNVVKFTEWHWEARFDPMIKVFPRMTKCTFYMFGTSGDIQKHDAVCILPINIINEKIYVFLWFWFVILSILTAGFLFYRLVTVLVPEVRFKIIYGRNRIVDSEKLRTIVYNLSIGDCFIFYQILKNIDPVYARDIVDTYASMLPGSDDMKKLRT